MFLAFAAEAAAEAAEGTKTFPPFDASLFPHQLFWFVLSFVALYAIMAKVALPRIAAVIARPRAFVNSPEYFGPDRRRRQQAYSGPNRRS